MVEQPWWHPERFARRRPFLEGRARVASRVRAWFEGQGFIEVETPALQVSPGLEPHLIAFSTELVGPNPDDRRTLYLHTSPEFAMKKLLVAGVPRLFQLPRSSGMVSGRALHSPEFTMLEWYRAGAGYRDLMVDCEALVRTAVRAGRARGVRVAGPDLRSVRSLGGSDRGGGVRPLCRHRSAGDGAGPAGSRCELLAREAERIGITPHAGDSREDLFFRISLDLIEPHLGMDRPTFLTDYPVSHGGAVEAEGRRSARGGAVRALCLRAGTGERVWRVDGCRACSAPGSRRIWT